MLAKVHRESISLDPTHRRNASSNIIEKNMFGSNSNVVKLYHIDQEYIKANKSDIYDINRRPVYQDQDRTSKEREFEEDYSMQYRNSKTQNYVNGHFK